MIYYYVKNKENYLKDGWILYPKEYPEMHEKVREFELKKYFQPTQDLSLSNFIILFELRHPLVAEKKILSLYRIPKETHNAIKKNRCKIVLFGWMENWNDRAFKRIFSVLKETHTWLEEKHFIFVTASAEEFKDIFGKDTNYFCLHANKLEWQWHECYYKKVDRLSKDKRFQPSDMFLCLNRRPAWHRFLTITRLFDFRNVGVITHLNKGSRYTDLQYDLALASKPYNDHYNHFKRAEIKELPTPRASVVPEEDWYGEMDVDESIEREARPNALDEDGNLIRGKLGRAKKWYWRKPSTGEVFWAYSDEEIRRIREEQLTRKYTPKIGPLAKKFKLKIEPKLPFIIKNDKHNILKGANPNKDMDAKKYLKAWIHVITETRIERDGGTGVYKPRSDIDQDLFISEKTFKAIFYKRPFLVVGQQGTLKRLHSLGYSTFPTIFNENYDNVKGNWRRINEVCDEVVKWIAKRKSSKQELFDECNSIREENFNNLMKRGRELEKNLHDSIMDILKDS